MITALQARKLRSNKIAIIKFNYYEEELKYIARKIQSAIKHNKSSILFYYTIETKWQYQVIIDILDDYAEIGYEYSLEETAEKNKYKLVIKF